MSNACLKCHGPDPKQRQGGGQDGLAAGCPGNRVGRPGGYAAIVPGKPDKSELIHRVTSDDPDLLMPPKASGKRLGEHEIALLKKWIEQGATFARHWSYVKPVRPAVPEVQDKTWPRNAIDPFFWPGWNARAQAVARGRPYCPDPPRVAGPDRPAADRRGGRPVRGRPSPDAYERLVDRLLAGDAYGEHWARMWLDLARYADSAGYADDPPRTIWAYRDYVIRSLNANKPFDQFTIEQIAGDLLPSRPTSSCRHGLPPQHADQQRRRDGRRGVPQRGRRGPRQHDDGRVDGHHDGLRPVPQPQVRPDLAAGVLPVLRAS